MKLILPYSMLFNYSIHSTYSVHKYRLLASSCMQNANVWRRSSSIPHARRIHHTYTWYVSIQSDKCHGSATNGHNKQTNKRWKKYIYILYWWIMRVIPRYISSYSTKQELFTLNCSRWRHFAPFRWIFIV